MLSESNFGFDNRMGLPTDKVVGQLLLRVDFERILFTSAVRDSVEAPFGGAHVAPFVLCPDPYAAGQSKHTA